MLVNYQPGSLYLGYRWLYPLAGLLIDVGMVFFVFFTSFLCFYFFLLYML